MNPETKSCQNCKATFVIEQDDFTFYGKLNVPSPTFCPECRLTRKLIWRNERTLYHRQCSLCSKKIISIYDENHTFDVYCPECWNSDNWDAFSYGLEVNEKNFFLNLEKLFQIVPRPSLDIVNSINSEYTNHTANVKNCYLTIGAIEVENGYYSDQCYFGKELFDADLIIKSSSIYWSGNCIDSFNVFYSEYAISCMDSYFLYDCVGCVNCFSCINLRNKSYCIFNKQYSKEEYLKKIKEYDLSSYSNLQKVKKEFSVFKLTQIHRSSFIKNSVNCSGNNIEHSNNCHYSFDLRAGAENLKYAVLCGYDMKDSYDVYGGGMTSDLGYESISFTGNHNVLFCKQVRQSSDVFYSEFCVNCHDLFGCIGLKNKSYCIFNKQYSKDEYFNLIKIMIAESFKEPYTSKLGHKYSYGEFLPFEFSYMSYNETAAHKFFPLEKENAISLGFKWKEHKKRNYIIDIKNKDLPDSIKDTEDPILGKIIECSHSGLCNHKCTDGFRILEAEFLFYKKNNIPIPRECPNCRYAERYLNRNPLKLWHRNCMKEGCNNQFETSYSPDRPEIVYCEKCYQQEVI